MAQVTITQDPVPMNTDENEEQEQTESVRHYQDEDRIQAAAEREEERLQRIDAHLTRLLEKPQIDEKIHLTHHTEFDLAVKRYLPEFAKLSGPDRCIVTRQLSFIVDTIQRSPGGFAWTWIFNQVYNASLMKVAIRGTKADFSWEIRAPKTQADSD